MTTIDLGLIDCYFYFDGNGCVKQPCPYRHCPIAKKNVEVCTNWLEGNCTWYNCPKRHMHKIAVEDGGEKVTEKSVLEELIAQGFDEEEAKQAVLQTKNLQSALIYLQQECGICSDLFSHNQMFCFATCEHSMCRNCAITHFETQIKSNAVTSVVCPYPDCVNLDTKDEEGIHKYFTLLILQLKDIMKTELMDLLEKKLLEWSLTSDPDFIRCPGCGNGMIIDDWNNNYITCLECNFRFCPNCKKVWTQQHVGLACEQHEALLESKSTLKDSDEALEKFLDSFGVVCPSCKTKFVKSSGGCLHFTCTVCKYKFCEGCLQHFYNKGECPQLHCSGLGFHAHHPRNCFFYLRDWTPERLQRLLNSTSISYETKPLHPGTKCPLIEQKEKDEEKLIDEACGEDVEHNSAGLCRKHYIQYLGWLVLKHKVDPILLYSTEELEHVLLKSRIPLPNMSSDYYEKLLDLVRNLKQTGGLSNTTTISEAYASLIVGGKENKNYKTDYSIKKPELFLKTGFVKSGEKRNVYFDYDGSDDSDEEDGDEEDEEDEEEKSAEAAAKPLNPFNAWVCSKCGLFNHGSRKCNCCYTNMTISFNNKEHQDKKLSDAVLRHREVQAVASFPVVETTAKLMPNTWACCFCTFINVGEKNICQICCRTKRLSLDDYEITFEGIECHCCTFLNELNATHCATCMTALKTEIDY